MVAATALSLPSSNSSSVALWSGFSTQLLVHCNHCHHSLQIRIGIYVYYKITARGTCKILLFLYMFWTLLVLTPKRLLRDHVRERWSMNYRRESIGKIKYLYLWQSRIKADGFIEQRRFSINITNFTLMAKSLDLTHTFLFLETQCLKTSFGFSFLSSTLFLVPQR